MVMAVTATSAMVVVVVVAAETVNFLAKLFQLR